MLNSDIMSNRLEHLKNVRNSIQLVKLHDLKNEILAEYTHDELFESSKES